MPATKIEPSDHALQRRQRLTGIALMCCAVASFSCLDATGKYLNHHMATTQVVWARYFFASFLTFLFSNPIKHPGIMRTSRPFMQTGRSALLLLSTALNLFALRWLQLDEALSIIFATPLLVAVLCVPLLGEHVGWRRWTAIVIGFCGVLVVARPGLGGLHPAALLSLGGSVCYAFYVISTRVLSRTDSNETTQFYTNLVGAVAMTVIVPFVWTWPDNAVIAGFDGADRRSGRRRALPADPCPPSGAGLDAGALHLHADGLDHDPRFPGVRRCAALLDDRGRGDCHLIRALPAPPRSRSQNRAIRTGCLSVMGGAKLP